MARKRVTLPRNDPQQAFLAPSPTPSPSPPLAKGSRAVLEGVRVVDFNDAPGFLVIGPGDALWTEGVSPGLFVRKGDFIRLYPPHDVPPEVVTMTVEHLESLGAVVRRMPRARSKTLPQSEAKSYSLRDAVVSLIQESHSARKRELESLCLEVMTAEKLLCRPPVGVRNVNRLISTKRLVGALSESNRFLPVGKGVPF